MRRLPLLILLAAGCARPAAPGPAPVPDPPGEQYPGCNVVFVSLDALQAKHVGRLGYPRNTTPNFDAFDRRATDYTQCRSVASWTVPASMTWFTGVYPSEHKLVNKFAVYDPPNITPANLKALAPHLITLADVFRANGYATGGFTGNAGVSGGFGYEQGFDVYEHDTGRFAGLSDSIPKALAWAAGRKGRKFFLFLHGYDCHGQHVPAGGYDYRFVNKDYDRRYTGAEIEQELLREEGLRRGTVAVRPADVEFWRAAYDEKVARADAQFGQFLAEFGRLGLMDNTLFVVTSDHGTELFEHGRVDHGYTLYDELLHVPLSIRTPGQAEPKIVSDRVSSIDVMPTVLALAGLTVPDAVGRQLRGKSLFPAPDAGRDAFAETDYRAFTFQRSVTTPAGLKLILRLETGGRELYDLAADPGETRDLAAARPADAEALQRRLAAHHRAIGRPLEGRAWAVGLNPVYPSQAKKE